MLNDNDKKEMLADGLNRQRLQEFQEAERRKHKSSGSFDDYIAFLMDAQRIIPFAHKPVITPTAKNIL